MDIRKLLHKYPKLKLAKENAKKGIAELERRDRIYRSDDNWFIRGTTVSDRTADTVIEEEAVLEKIALLKGIVERLDTLLTAIEDVLLVLDPEQQLIAKYCYFQGMKVHDVCLKIAEETGTACSESKFYYSQRLLLEDFKLSLGGLLLSYSDDFINSVQFAVAGTRLDTLAEKRTAHSKYNRLKFAVN